MHPLACRFGILLATIAVSAPALSQPVIRCGNAYADQACPGGTVVPAGDPRSEAQRAQAAAAIARDARMAQALESARLEAEARVPLAPPTVVSPRKTAAKPGGQPPSRPKKTRAPDHFTAVAPAKAGEKKPRGKRSARGAKNGEQDKSPRAANGGGNWPAPQR